MEKRLEEGKGSEIARQCWREVRERSRKLRKITSSGWEREKKEFFEERRVNMMGDGVGGRGEGRVGEVIRADRERQKAERWSRIEISSFNRWYRLIKGKEIPTYLRKGEQMEKAGYIQTAE